MTRSATYAAVSALALLTSALLVACSHPDAEQAAEMGGASSGGASSGGVSSGGAPTRQPGGASSGGAGEPPVATGGSADEPSGSAGAAGASDGATPDSPYAHEVVSFFAGDSAGFNADKLPGVVLGPPSGLGNGAGSLDVLSLGAGGEIVLGFGNRGIVDGDGPDFIVFENPFWPNGEASAVFAELGEVSVSEDGETWRTFECDVSGDGEGSYPGCAGWTPTLEYDAETLVPLDPDATGGDAFDLADVGLERARFVKIRDLETLPPGGTNAGFDLDAVGIIHAD